MHMIGPPKGFFYFLVSYPRWSKCGTTRTSNKRMGYISVAGVSKCFQEHFKMSMQEVFAMLCQRVKDLLHLRIDNSW